MKTAAELRKSLVDLGLPDEQIEEIVKGQIESGKVTEGDASISMQDAQTVAEELAKSLELAPPEPAATEPATATEPDEDGMIDVYEKLEHFAKAADGLIERQEAYTEYTTGQVEVLQKAWLAGLKIQEQLVEQNTEQSTLIKGMQEKLEAIATQLGTPMLPRSVTGTAEAQPSPGEQMTKGPDVRDTVLAEIGTRMAKSADPQEKFVLLQATSQIDSGVDPAEIAKSLAINLSASA